MSTATPPPAKKVGFLESLITKVDSVVAHGAAGVDTLIAGAAGAVGKLISGPERALVEEVAKDVEDGMKMDDAAGAAVAKAPVAAPTPPPATS